MKEVKKVEEIEVSKMMMIKRCDDDTNNDDNAASNPREIEMLERSIRTQRETKAPFELRCFLQIAFLPPQKPSSVK